jgi:hypothetical protein
MYSRKTIPGPEKDHPWYVGASFEKGENSFLIYNKWKTCLGTGDTLIFC